MNTASPTPSVLILYTGGTIGMRPGQNGLEPGGDFAKRAREALNALPASRRQALPAFVFHEYDDPIDSSSARPSQWYRLGDDIRRYGAGYAGVVVIHGTDTLAWSAASLAWQLDDWRSPVVVTGAQRPLEAEGSDGPGNLEFALTAAAHPALSGVLVAFGDRLLEGAAARKWDTCADRAFASPNASPCGKWCDHRLVLSFQAPESASSPKSAASADSASSVERGRATPRLVRLVLWPGIEAQSTDALLQEADGAILEAWGSGNLPEDPALIDSLESAAARGTALVVLSQCPGGATCLQSYAAGRSLIELGVIDGGAMTPEAAFTRLHWLLTCGFRGEGLRHRFMPNQTIIADTLHCEHNAHSSNRC